MARDNRHNVALDLEEITGVLRVDSPGKGRIAVVYDEDELVMGEDQVRRINEDVYTDVMDEIEETMFTTEGKEGREYFEFYPVKGIAKQHFVL